MVVRVNPHDCVGKKYNKLTVIEMLGYWDGYRHCIARCDCGVVREHNFQSIKNGVTKTCGCILKEHKGSGGTHNLTKHPLYEVWRGMRQRCYYKKAPMYYLYGGAGVKVCREWRSDFKAFYDWAINNGYKAGLELDKDKKSPYKTGRIYSPKYCTFLTPKENIRLRENSIFIKYKGEKKTLIEWCEILDINFKRARNRYYSGWKVKDILETPVMKTKLISYNGEERTLPEWCNKLGVKYDSIRGRIRVGWSYERALSTPFGKYSKHKIAS